MLKDILSIGGYSGLYKFISQGRNGIIVESLETKQRMNANTTAKISALEDIAIFTYEEDIPLKDVLKKIYDKENGKGWKTRYYIIKEEEGGKHSRKSKS